MRRRTSRGAASLCRPIFWARSAWARQHGTAVGFKQATGSGASASGMSKTPSADTSSDRAGALLIVAETCLPRSNGGGVCFLIFFFFLGGGMPAVSARCRRPTSERSHPLVFPPSNLFQAHTVPVRVAFVRRGGAGVADYRAAVPDRSRCRGRGSVARPLGGPLGLLSGL